MNNLLTALRQLLGQATGWYHSFTTNAAGGQTFQWDYGMMFEYLIAGVLACLVITNVFRLLRCLIRGA